MEEHVHYGFIYKHLKNPNDPGFSSTDLAYSHNGKPRRLVKYGNGTETFWCDDIRRDSPEPKEGATASLFELICLGVVGDYIEGVVVPHGVDVEYTEVKRFGVTDPHRHRHSGYWYGLSVEETTDDVVTEEWNGFSRRTPPLPKTIDDMMKLIETAKEGIEPGAIALQADSFGFLSRAGKTVTALSLAQSLETLKVLGVPEDFLTGSTKYSTSKISAGMVIGIRPSDFPEDLRADLSDLEYKPPICGFVYTSLPDPNVEGFETVEVGGKGGYKRALRKHVDAKGCVFLCDCALAIHPDIVTTYFPNLRSIGPVGDFVEMRYVPYPPIPGLDTLTEEE